MKPYSDCIYCGGGIVERKERIDYRLHGQLFIPENVQAGVCCQCGEQYFTAEEAKEMEAAAESSRGNIRTVAVPVIAVGK